MSGQNGFGADIVSTARPAFIVFLDLEVLAPLTPVLPVAVLFILLPLKVEYCFCRAKTVENDLV